MFLKKNHTTVRETQRESFSSTRKKSIPVPCKTLPYPDCIAIHDEWTVQLLPANIKPALVCMYKLCLPVCFIDILPWPIEFRFLKDV